MATGFIMSSSSLTNGESGVPSNIRRALVIDDDVRISALLVGHLVDLGIEVESTHGPTISTILEAFSPDLIFLDVKLGSTDAFTLIRTQIPPTFRGVVSIMSGLGLDTITNVMLFGERSGLTIGAPLLKPMCVNDVHQLVETADQLLERRSILASDSNQKSAVLTATPLRLKQALDTDALEVWYQPKFNIQSEAMVGAEALIRGRRSDRSVVSPYELLFEATKEDKIALTEFILTAGIGHGKMLNVLGFTKRLSFNTPVSYLLQPDPVEIIRNAALTPEWSGMIFEVTEDEILNDIEHLQAIAVQLKLYNISLSIDDFGAAYSSLERLRDLPFCELKLDRSFVRGCAVDSTKRSICKSVIALGAELGVTTVAEGIEDQGDLEAITELGCDQVQGFLFGKPMPFENLCRLVQAGAVSQIAPDSLRLPGPT